MTRTEVDTIKEIHMDIRVTNRTCRIRTKDIQRIQTIDIKAIQITDVQKNKFYENY